MFGNISQAGRNCSKLGNIVNSFSVLLTDCKQGLYPTQKF